MAKHPHRREPLSTADRKGDVAKDLSRLKGRSEANVMGDSTRGSLSPLGGSKYHVTKPKEQGRGR